MAPSQRVSDASASAPLLTRKLVEREARHSAHVGVCIHHIPAYNLKPSAALLYLCLSDPIMSRPAFLCRAAVLTVALAAPLFALAHPKLLKAIPAVNGHVATMPTEVRLTFQEPIEPALSKITIVHAGRHSVTVSAVATDSVVRRTLVALIKTPMGAGVYSVTWQAAGADGHPIRGTYTFTVDAAGAK